MTQKEQAIKDCGWQESPIIKMPPNIKDMTKFKTKFKLPNKEDFLKNINYESTKRQKNKRVQS